MGNYASVLGEISVLLSLTKASEEDVMPMEETFDLLNNLLEFNDPIITKPPYAEIMEANIPDSVRERILQFNSLYQASVGILNGELDLLQTTHLKLTSVQDKMPERYIAKCGFMDLKWIYGDIPKTSAKRKLNRRIVSGFSRKHLGARLHEGLLEKVEDVELPEDYSKHFNFFAEISGSYRAGASFGRVFDSV